jgi:hypothetical protein
MEDTRNSHENFFGKPEDLSIDGAIILKLVLQE